MRRNESKEGTLPLPFRRKRMLLTLCVSCLVLMTYAQESPHGEISVACDACHGTESWNLMASPMRFNHRTTGFPLEGQHEQIACRQCHTTLHFAATPDRCASCHDDVHRKELGGMCDRCHTPSSWLVPDMPQRHLTTRFALLGAHRLAQCRSCHTNLEKHTYAGVPIECVACHGADYDATVAPPHRSSGISTDCASCHSVSALTWGGHFDHAQTGFRLTGAHTAVPCAGCHKGGAYAALSDQCVSCHLPRFTATTNPPHAASGFSTDCRSCHTTTTWIPATFDHEPFFPISSGSTHRPGRWNACADCHTNAGSYQVFTCLNCHEHSQNTVDPKHTGVAGYRYDSQSCYSCHPRGRE